MKVLIDIGHPAHVHYFRNAIKLLEAKGHKILITARDKEVSLDLLKAYNLPYICTGKNKSALINKFFALIKNDFMILRAALKFKPDIFLSAFSPFCAHIGWILRKPVIGFADTEHAKLSNKITRPFTSYIFSPRCFTLDYGSKHYLFNAYLETFYMHPNYFTPNKDVVKQLGLSEPYYILRFVSFNASHDIGQSGISYEIKLNLIDILSKKGTVYISSESQLPENLEKYRLKIKPSDLHHVLAFSDMYIGEGSTTASECAHLGVPTVYVNSLDLGYMQELSKYQLIYNYRNADKLIETVQMLLNKPNLKAEFKSHQENLINSIIDNTAFLVNLIDEYPNSIRKLKKKL